MAEPRRAICALMSLLVLATTAVARADEGDAGEGEAGEATVAVVVTAADGVKFPAARRATVQVSVERALKRDKRLIVVDKDDRLAAKAKRVPADVVNEARALLESGEALLKRGQAKAALLKLEGASVQLARVLAWTQKQELARAQFLLGAAQALSGDTKSAQATFTALLAWRPEAVADADLEPSVILPIWEKAQAKAAKLPGGSIDIETRPDGALAYVDGKLAGFTPTVVEGLAVGVHYVTVRRDGHERRVEAVRISDKKAVRLSVKLEPSRRGAELAAAEQALTTGLGAELAPAEAQAGFAEAGELLGVEQIVVVSAETGEGRYRVFVYDTSGGARLAAESLSVGDRELEDAFADVAGPLYAQVARAKVKVVPRPPKKKKPSGPSIFSNKWFWITAGGIVAIGATTGLILSIDRTEPLTCPAGTSCGEIIFRF
jgi:tetratricopeptide (TPR) repeat protein